MMILNNSKNIPKGVYGRGHFDIAIDHLHRVVFSCPQLDKPRQFLFDIFNTPIYDRAIASDCFPRFKTEFKAIDIVTDIERLLIIRLGPQSFVIPILRFMDVVYVIDGCL